MDNDFCNSVLPIPQYGPTCWFNAILMCILKSQNSRKLLIDKFKINSKSSKYLKIIYGLLMKSYILNSKLYNYYEKLNLHSLLKYIIFDKKHRQKYDNSGHAYFFLPLFIQSLNMSSLSIFTSSNSNKEFCCGYNEYIANKWGFCENGEKIYHSIDYYEKLFKEKFNTDLNPDYIFITIIDDKYCNSEIFKIGNIDNFSKIKYDKNLKEFKDFTLNNNYYTLDSCILKNNNYDDIKFSHAIAGIKCKNDKYVYNGWIKATTDKTMIDKNANKTPCLLMKYDWEVNNKNDDFCLNTIQCKLDKFNPKKLCFSFGKGTKTLIFAKTVKEFISIDKNISNSSSILYPSNSFSDKDKYEKNKLNNKEIDMDKDFCNSVLPIPQYQNTCWFTTALMCILRSQHSRRFLLNNLKINDKSPKVILQILKLMNIIRNLIYIILLNILFVKKQLLIELLKKVIVFRYLCHYLLKQWV